MLAFFNSNFFVGVVTLVAGLVAWFLYAKQKRDSKRDFASIILLEIQNAERIIEQVRPTVQKGVIPEVSVLPDDSWSKYRYRFVRDFDRDEWDTITAFYKACKEFDAACRYNGSFFNQNAEQLRVNLLRVAADYMKEGLELSKGPNPTMTEEQAIALSQANATAFQTQYIEVVKLVSYSPIKPKTDMAAAFANLSAQLSLTSIGAKLKALAGHDEAGMIRRFLRKVI